MLNGNIRGGRARATGTVDFTMMYVAHDAFTRDLRRIAAVAVAGQTSDPAVGTGWAMFEKQLHIQHTAEDRSQWPTLREKVTRPDQVAVLDPMEAEHARIDPQLDAVDQALARSDAVRFTESVQALAEGLTARMQHEESAALPLVETCLGPGGWAAFGQAIRRTQGLRDGAEYVPWLLDDAPIATQAEVLRLPPPVILPLPPRVPRRSTGAFPDGTATPAFDGKAPDIATLTPTTRHVWFPDRWPVPHPPLIHLAASAGRAPTGSVPGQRRRTTHGLTPHHPAQRPGRLGTDDRDPRRAAPRPGPAAAHQDQPHGGPGPLDHLP